MKRVLPIIALASLLAACATVPNANEQPRRPWHAVPLDDVRIAADRATDDRKAQAVVIYGDGVAVWNNSVQFRVDPGTIRQILASFDAAGFETIQNSPKGKVLRRRAAIRAGAYSHEAWESWEQELTRKDEQETIKRGRERRGLPPETPSEPPLTTLVDSIINTVAPIVEKGGTTADSLADGLKKIASGQLAPETLSLTMLVKPEPGRGEESGGFLFKIQEGTASWSDFQGEQRGFGTERNVKVPAARLRDLASRLASFDPESLPANLYSPKYQEVIIFVMSRQKSTLARPFAGLTPEKHGEAQTRFDAMMTVLTSVGSELFGGKRR